MNRDNRSRFVDPFSLPDDDQRHHRPNNDLSQIDLYDLDLHDDYDWLAQPCATAPPIWGTKGQDNES